MRKMKRRLATLLAVVMVLSSLPMNTFADSVTGLVDRSKDFVIDLLTLTVNNKEIYNTAEVDMYLEGYENPTVAFKLSWEQKDSTQSDFKDGDYFRFDICTVSGSTAAIFSGSGIDSSIDLYIGNTCLGTGTLRSETIGENVTLYYQVVFNGNIENMSNISGKAEGNATVTKLNTGDKVKFIVADAALAEFEKITSPNADKGTFANGSGATNTDLSKSSLRYTGADKTVYWRIFLNELVTKQFDDFQKGIIPNYDYLIVEDTLDLHQTFTTVNTTSDNPFGLFLELRRPVFLYNSTANYEWDAKNPTGISPYPIWIQNNTGFRLPEKLAMTAIIPEDYASAKDAETKVKETPRTYTVLKEEDPGNLGYTRERLIMNFGAPGNGGFKYWELGEQGSILSNLKTQFAPAKEAIDYWEWDDKGQHTFYSEYDNKKYTYTQAEWRYWLQSIDDSIVYYSNNPWIYAFELDIKTKVKTDQIVTSKVGSVTNSFSTSGGFGGTNVSNAQKNGWSANINATVANGDVLIYKLDFLYGFGNLEGAIEGVEFKVYKESDDSILRFNHLDNGKYQYNAGEALEVVTTDAAGSIILSGLPAGVSYYLKEFSAPEGYYFSDEEKTAFTVNSANYVTKWIYNDPMGVTLTKVDAESGDPLEGAMFELYKMDGDGDEKVTSFKTTKIQGTTYLVYDDSGDDLLKTGRDGKLTIVRLPAGKYYLVEVSAPDGYQLSKEKHGFTLPDAESQNAIVDLGIIENEKTKPTPTPVEVNLGGKKTLDGAELTDYQGAFEFVLTQNGDPAVMTGTETVKNDENGFIFSGLTFKEAGQYTFTVTESAGDLAGIEYDETSYTVTVDVSLKEDTNDLAATVTYQKGEEPATGIIFENRYKPPTPVTVALTGTKKLDGAKITDYNDAFEFVLTQDGDPAVMTGAETVRNDGSGFAFSGLTFKEAGQYTFTVKERAGNLAGMTYDETSYTVTVDVSLKEGTNDLAATVTYQKGGAPASGIIFANEYTEPNAVTAIINGSKTLNGAKIADYQGEFEFVLTQRGGPTVLASAETTVNDGDEFTFSELTFAEAGEYIFTVTESGGTEAGITYDNTLYTIVVTVEWDATTKTLEKDVVIRNVTKGRAADVIEFKNEYTPPEVPIATPSGAINILKVNENEKALSGAIFAIYNATATASNATPVATLKSGASGYDAKGVTLNPGSYRLVETKAPTGYTGTDEIVYFIVNNKGLIDNIRYSKDDTATSSNASMASSSNAVHYEADYYYFDADGNMQTVDSLEEWEEIKDSVDIILLEDDGPILRILFTVVNEWNGNDEPDEGFIKIAKYYDPNGNEVPDEAKNGRQTYSFYVRDKDGKLVTTASVSVYWDAARNMFYGTTTVGNLVAGEKYYITEVRGFDSPFTFAWNSATANAYALEDGYLVVTAGKSAATAPMITGINMARPTGKADVVETYTLALLKHNVRGNVLNGITFTLENSAGETVSIVTADGGKAVFSGLTEGTYTLKEVKYGRYKIMSDYTFTVGSTPENCTVTEVGGRRYIQLTNKRTAGASGFDTAVETDNVLWNVIVNTTTSGGDGGGDGGGGTTPGTPTTPTNPDNPTTPTTPVTPALPSVIPGHSLVPNGDGSYYEIDENGVALGRWYQDEDGVWIFDEMVPLGGLAKTGEQNAQWLMLMMLMSGLGGAALVCKRRKEEEA